MVDFNDRRAGTKHSTSYGEISKDQFGDYTSAYRAGYRHSSSASSPDLDRNPYQQESGTRDKAWEDGYLDAAAGRAKYALRGHRFGTGDPVEGY